MQAAPMLCLAKSRKFLGFCVAGRRFDHGQAGAWIRPVSPSRGEGVRPAQMRYADGTELVLLDIARVPLIGPQPDGYQSENHLLDVKSPWQYEGRASWTAIFQAQDSPGGDFWDDHGDTRYGLRDKVPAVATFSLGTSLRLIYVRNIQLLVRRELHKLYKLKVRAEFDFDGGRYRLAVTDPVIEKYCLDHGPGVYTREIAMLCISISESFNGSAYRLVASVITPQRCEVKR